MYKEYIGFALPRWDHFVFLSLRPNAGGVGDTRKYGTIAVLFRIISEPKAIRSMARLMYKEYIGPLPSRWDHFVLIRFCEKV